MIPTSNHRDFYSLLLRTRFLQPLTPFLGLFPVLDTPGILIPGSHADVVLMDIFQTLSCNSKHLLDLRRILTADILLLARVFPQVEQGRSVLYTRAALTLAEKQFVVPNTNGIAETPALPVEQVCSWMLLTLTGNGSPDADTVELLYTIGDLDLDTACLRQIANCISYRRGDRMASCV